ncbi:MAG: MFS transporter [Acuticoccus sp.]
MIHASPTASAGAATAALALATLIASLGVSIATVALPSMARDLGASVTAVQWVVVAYLLAVTVSIVTAGRLGDVYGHRAVLLAGLILFGAGAVLTAAAPGLGGVIAGRVAQGIGGAILMALPIAIVRDAVAPARIGAAMGLLGSMSAVGTALGPSAGGVLIAASGWRAAFAALAVVAAAVLVLALAAIPSIATGGRRSGGLGLPSAAALALMLTGYVLLALGGTAGMPFGAAGLVGLVLVGGALFRLAEARAPAPLLPLALLRQRAVCAALAMNALVTTVMMATLVVGPFHLTFALGLGEAEVGLAMAVGPLTAALAGVPAGRLTDRFGERRMLVVGLVQIAMALVAFALLPRAIGIAGYVVALMALTPGFQLFLAANNTLVMMAAPEGARGVLSGLVGLSRNLGFMTGASVMATLFALALGPVAVTEAGAGAVGAAFTATFLAGAGLVVLALALAFVDPAPGRKT